MPHQEHILAFRPLTFADYSELIHLFPEPTLGSHKKRLQQQEKDVYSYICAELDNEIAAIQLIRWGGPQREADRLLSQLPEIDCLYTLPEFRGKGIGSALIKHSENEIMSRGYSGVGAIIKDENTISIQMHSKDGYQKVGTASRAKQDPDKPRSYYVKQFFQTDL